MLITGDALLTVNVNSVPNLLADRHRVAGPPYISTWNWPAARRSVAALASLDPDVLACGHGRPMTGPGTASRLTAFSDRLSQHRSPRRIRHGTASTAAGTGGNPAPGNPGHQSARLSCKATGEERAMRLPGDDLVAAPIAQTTQAVTIGAPMQQVRPWLVQTGQGRAGFYSDSKFWDRCVDWYYRRLSRRQPGEAAVGYHVAADDRIVAAWQNARVGGDGLLRRAAGRAGTIFRPVHRHPPAVPACLRDNPRLGISGEISDSFQLTEPEPGTTRADPPHATHLPALALPPLRRPCRPDLGRGHHRTPPAGRHQAASRSRQPNRRRGGEANQRGCDAGRRAGAEMTQPPGPA